MDELQWRIQFFAVRGANRELSDNAVLPQHIVLWLAHGVRTYSNSLVSLNMLGHTELQYMAPSQKILYPLCVGEGLACRRRNFFWRLIAYNGGHAIANAH